ncbi:MAG: hypothetical protein LQ340_001234 [Diploschistes diacapsis]|nr:MAG: hypothetical protein LQ340_001234 [Diploschistes diacapsis]
MLQLSDPSPLSRSYRDRNGHFPAQCTSILRLSVCLFIICFLCSSVAGASVQRRDNIGVSTEGNRQFLVWTNATSGKKVVMDYPWVAEHDSRMTRKNHMYWGYKMDHAYCVHFNPAFRPPGTHPRVYLGEHCTAGLHYNLEGKDVTHHFLMPCHKAGEDRAMPAEYLYTLVLEKWEDAEHCRAGCETCFDAMHEYGAASAFCNRYKFHAHCYMSVRHKSFKGLWDDKLRPGRFIYYGNNRGMQQKHLYWPADLEFSILPKVPWDSASEPKFNPNVSTDEFVD